MTNKAKEQLNKTTRVEEIKEILRAEEEAMGVTTAVSELLIERQAQKIIEKITPSIIQRIDVEKVKEEFAKFFDFRGNQVGGKGKKGTGAIYNAQEVNRFNDIWQFFLPYLNLDEGKIKREAVEGFVKYCSQFDFSNRDEKDQKFCGSCLEELDKIIPDYLSQQTTPEEGK
jgi:hypothetical protein